MYCLLWWLIWTLGSHLGSRPGFRQEKTISGPLIATIADLRNSITTTTREFGHVLAHIPDAAGADFSTSTCGRRNSKVLVAFWDRWSPGIFWKTVKSALMRLESYARHRRRRSAQPSTFYRAKYRHGDSASERSFNCAQNEPIRNVLSWEIKMLRPSKETWGRRKTTF